MDVAFAHARIGDSHERRPRAHLFDRLAAGVAHRGPQAAGELVENLDERAFVRHATLDALRDELLQLFGRILEIAILRAVRLRHRSERAHAAIRLVGRALVQLDFARRLFGASEQTANHHAVRAGDQRLGDITGEANAAVRDQRYTGAFQRSGNVRDCGDLRHADAGNDSSRADRAGTDADLDAVRTRFDGRLGSFSG